MDGGEVTVTWERTKTRTAMTTTRMTKTNGVVLNPVHQKRMFLHGVRCKYCAKLIKYGSRVVKQKQLQYLTALLF